MIRDFYRSILVLHSKLLIVIPARNPGTSFNRQRKECHTILGNPSANKKVFEVGEPGVEL